MIYIYIYKNKESLKYFFTKEENKTDEHYENRYNKYVNSIRIDNIYAGDYDLTTAANILQRKIIIYRNSKSGYEFLTDYNLKNSSKVPIFAYIIML